MQHHDTSSGNVASSGNLPSIVPHEPSGLPSGYEDATVAFSTPDGSTRGLPDTAVWPSSDSFFLPDNKVPLQWQGDVHDWPPSVLYNEFSNRPDGSSLAGPPRAEIGEWNQLLDNLGVWG